MDIEFEWNARKATANLKKHGVAFKEAQSAFFDEFARVYFDPDHSGEEDRFLLLGTSYKLNTVIVSHCYRESEGRIRIMSARKADQSEEAEYWSFRK